MTLITVPVRVEHGTIYTVDGTTLPENADALLILLPSSTDPTKRIPDEPDERQQAFTRFYTTVHQATQAIQLDELDDDQLNDLVHAARSA